MLTGKIKEIYEKMRDQFGTEEEYQEFIKEAEEATENGIRKYYNKMIIFKLSDQAIGAIMMSLQKGLLEQMDITQLLRDFELENNEEMGLIVLNPPTFEVQQEEK